MRRPRNPNKPELKTPPPAPRPDTVQLRARRSPKLVALGVLLVAGGGIGAALLYGSGSEHEALVAMASDVRRGDVIERTDLQVIELPPDLAPEALPAADLVSLVGERALTDLPAGAFPLPRHVGDNPLPSGQSLVGLRLTIGRLPISDLPPGTTVRIVGLGESAETTVAAVVARTPVLLDDAISYAVDVRVADSEADLVARLSATDQVALLIVGAA